jgi:Zn-dependent M28 family amino/carboxypeptidase
LQVFNVFLGQNQPKNYLLMYFKILYLMMLFPLLLVNCHAQNMDSKEVERIITQLASDEMLGREAGTQNAEKAALFIADEFKKVGLGYFADLKSYLQPFKRGKTDYQNVVGILEGKSKKDEYILFSAHYDHLGVLTTVDGDSIANGADDDASGVTALIMLAQYFKEKADNERTLIFVAFTAEEIGGYGSEHFSKLINPQQYIAGVNMEMLGKISKFGKNAAFITGFEKSNFGKILQKNVAGKGFQFQPDPYPEQNLFYRSDNARFATQGIPAHTISTVQIDKDNYYHTVDDEVSTLDMENLTATIEAIALGVKTLVSGEDTPSRLK